MTEEIVPMPGCISQVFYFAKDYFENVINDCERVGYYIAMKGEISKVRIDLMNNKPFSYNIFHAIVFNFERYKLSGEKRLFWQSMKALRFVCWQRLGSKLLEMGILVLLSEIMTREAEKQMSNHIWTETKESAALLFIISEFFARIEDSDYIDITSRSNKFFKSAWSLPIFAEQQIQSSLKIAFPQCFKICQIRHCPTSYRILFLKMIYSAIIYSSDVMNIEEIIRYAKNLIDTNPIHEDNIAIGFAIVKMMYPKYARWLISERISESMKAKNLIVLSWLRNGRFKSFFMILCSMVTYWLRKDTISNLQIDEENIIPRIETVNSTLARIMPNVDSEGLSHMSLDINYSNLREFLKDIFNLPDISCHKGQLTASVEGVRKFNYLVRFIVRTIDALIIRSDVVEDISDLCELEDLPVPISPMDIKLELYTSASFNRVLRSSKSPEELKTNPLVRALRLLSILHEVNENWGILFGSLSTERLIDRSCFVSELMNEVIIRTKVSELNPCRVLPPFLDKFAATYPYMILMEHRRYVFSGKMVTQYPWLLVQYPLVKLFSIPRKNLFNTFAKILESEVIKAHHRWGFQFNGELGAIMGSSKEFFSEFSLDCQKFSRGLWSGEAGNVVDGVSYVKSQSGLFPLPNSLNNPMTKSYLNSLGMVMAKAITDTQILDIHFSDAFYKCLFKTNLDAQQLSLLDIKDVMPSIFKFVESLVDALREKWSIRNDSSLATEEQDQAISNITCDGCSFDDLCLNFTLPGFPHIEMMEGGSETFLSIENVENYLKLLVWWLLYENPHKYMKEIRNGFEKIINPLMMKYFYPHEYEELFCGLVKELWTMDILKQNCVLHDLTVETPIVQYLFEVLSSLSANDQRHFLQFVTAAPRLPAGGLAALNPELTIRYKRVNGNPNNYLPESFTCHNTLFVTDYSSKEALEEKLLLAIREGRNAFSFV